LRLIYLKIYTQNNNNNKYSQHITKQPHL